MNCEKCKNQKATVFYADETGGRHSLCASCAALLGKAAPYPPSETSNSRRPGFIPDPTLLTLIPFDANLPIYCSEDRNDGIVCPSCKTNLASVRASGEVGCPDCYTVFGDILFPTSLTPESAGGARMPSSRRYDIERIRKINDLRSSIRSAVESENYELAASLRDEVRRLESKKHA